MYGQFTMEPGNTRLIEFELDSYDCQGSYSGNPGISKTNWPLFALRRQLDKVAYVKILEVQVPFSYYVFNTANNTFTLVENGGTNTLVTIPIGNYDSTTLGTALQTALNTASQNGYTYTVTYSTRLMKYIITNNNSNGSFTLNFGGSSIVEGNYDPSIMVGANQTQTSTLVSGTPTLQMPNVPKISGPDYLYLRSATIGGACDVYLPASSENLGNVDDFVTKIPVNVNSTGTIFWTDPLPQRFYKVQLGNIPTIDFYFTLGNWSNQIPLDFGGQSFSIKLGILFEEPTQDIALSGTIEHDYIIKTVGPYTGAKRPRFK